MPNFCGALISSLFFVSCDCILAPTPWHIAPSRSISLFETSGAQRTVHKLTAEGCEKRRPLPKTVGVVQARYTIQDVFCQSLRFYEGMPDREEHLKALILASVSVDFDTDMGNMLIMHRREDTKEDAGFQPELSYKDWFTKIHFDSNITGAMMDVGANNGDTTVYLAKKYPRVHIYALEPIPDNCFFTTWNLLANGISLDRVSVLRGALVAPGSGTKRILTSPEYTSENWETQPSSIQVPSDVSFHFERIEKAPSMTMSSIFKRIEKDGFTNILAIKTNCEGCEYEFIPSLSTDDARRIQYICGEIHPDMANFYTERSRLSTYSRLCTNEFWSADNRFLPDCELQAGKALAIKHEGNSTAAQVVPRELPPELLKS